MKRRIAIIVLVMMFSGTAGAATLQVSLPAINVPGATVGTEFDVPVSVTIPGGLTNQGLARLYVRIASTGSANMIAPVTSGSLASTTFGGLLTGYDVKFSSFLRDLDADGDTDAGDAAVVDLGGNTNKNIGIGSSVVVMTQRWKFVGTPTPGTHYALNVQFPVTKGRSYNSAGASVVFDTQTDVDGSVMKTGADIADLAALLAAMDSVENGPGWNPDCDQDNDKEITSTDLSLLLANMN